MDQSKFPWSAPVTVEDVPDTGLHLEIEAPEATRAEIARLANVLSVSALSAVFDVVRRGAGAHVSGEVTARVGQTCVVTLEPMENDVTESIDLDFAPAAGSAVEVEDGEEIDLGTSEEPPEPLVNGAVDLGKIATEFLLLGIDPYPRKQDAEFAAPKVEEPQTRPFAALESLKKKLGGGQS